MVRTLSCLLPLGGQERDRTPHEDGMAACSGTLVTSNASRRKNNSTRGQLLSSVHKKLSLKNYFAVL